VLAGTAFKDEQVVALSRSFVPVFADKETEERWAAEHGVSGIPVVVYADAAGEVWSATLGAEKTEVVLADMRTALAGLAGAGEPDDPETDEMYDPEDEGEDD
jgi:hypothetical protein